MPLLQSLRGEGQVDGGTPGKTTFTVIDRKFEPVPEDEFTPERLLGDAPVKRVGPEQDPVEVAGLLRWYPFPILLGALSLAAGGLIAALARKRRDDP